MNKKLIQLFEKIQNGDLSQIDEVYSILYNDIKAIAAYQINLVNSGETVTPTVLANECYLKLIKAKNIPSHDRRHFMQYLSKSMRSFLLDTIRAKNSLKRNGLQMDASISQYVGLDDIDIRFMDIDRMLNLVDEVDHVLAEILQYKLIFNLTYIEIGDLLNKSDRHIQRLWKRAKSLLIALMNFDENKSL
jgi:RNA polymerase sigma factor (TIGR02999 family)